MSSAELLKNPTCSMILSIMNEAMQLQYSFGDQFVEPPKGLYAAGQIEPSIYFDRIYYQEVMTINNQMTFIRVDDIDKITGALFDSNFKMVLNQFQVTNKDKWLKQYPTVPSVALKIVFLLVQEYFNSICPYKSFNYNTTDKILRLLKPGSEDLYHSGELELVLSGLFSRVSEFVKSDNWYIYFQKFIGIDVLIEKMCDYRVYDWYVIKEAEKEKQKLDMEIQDYGNIRCL